VASEPGVIVVTVSPAESEGSDVTVVLVVPEQATNARVRTASRSRGRRTVVTVDTPMFRQGKSGLARETLDCLYTRWSVPNNTLYFAYGSLLDPDRMSGAAPGSKFLFTAHYPETRLDFVAPDGDNAVPTLVKESGHTVWGGVFEVPDDEVDALAAAEKAEGRRPGFDAKAVDREGNKHDCLTFVAVGEPNGDHRPDPDYLASMINGARHWSLPAGWVMGLEDLAEGPLF
jgi:hypothetical protein